MERKNSNSTVAGLQSMDQSEQRNTQIDVLRGMAILLVVLEHSIGATNDPIVKIILSFHMPLFFIISGYLSHNEKSRPFKEVVLKKIQSLLIPQFTLACISFAYNWLIANMLLHQATASDLNFISCFTRWWFFLVLFCVDIVWEFIIRIKINHKVRDAIIVASSAIYIILIPQNIRGPLYILVAPVALGFFAVGNLFKDYFCQVEYTKPKYICAMIIGGITIFAGLSNIPVLMYDNQYGNEMLFLLSSISGFLTMYILAGWIKKNRFLCWCGRNSIIIYVIHFYIVQGTRGILVRLLPNSSEYIWILVFMIAACIVIVGTIICEKYLGLLFGKGIKK